MPASKEDVMLLLQFDQVYRPGVPARKFAYSAALAEAVEAGDFFERFTMDSDERFFVNELGTYYELLGMFRREQIVDPDLALEWAAPAFVWRKIGPVLIKAREVFGADRLWEDFEGLAKAQEEAI